MKQKLLLTFLLFVIIKEIKLTNIPNSTSYPSDGDTAKISIYQAEKVLVDTDNVGLSGTNDFYGFAWMKGGFNLNDTSGTVDFASPFPVGTHINLDGQLVLRLQSDLILAADIGLEAGVNSSGILDCNGNSIVLSGDFSLPSDGVGNERYVEFVDSGARIFANGNAIDFSPGGYLKVGSGCSYLSFRSAIFRDVKSNSFQFDDSTKTLYLWNSKLSISEDIVFDHNVGIVGDFSVTGTHMICFNRNLDFYDNGKLVMDIGTTFSFGASSSINLVGPKRKGTIHFNGCNIKIGDQDFNTNGGRILFENQVTIDDEGNYKDFICNAQSLVDVIGNARIVLESTTTFSIL